MKVLAVTLVHHGRSQDRPMQGRNFGLKSGGC